MQVAEVALGRRGCCRGRIATKKDSSGVAPASIPASCSPSRKNVTDIVMRARVMTSLGSNTAHCSGDLQRLLDHRHEPPYVDEAPVRDRSTSCARRARAGPDRRSCGSTLTPAAFRIPCVASSTTDAGSRQPSRAGRLAGAWCTPVSRSVAACHAGDVTARRAPYGSMPSRRVIGSTTRSHGIVQRRELSCRSAPASRARRGSRGRVPHDVGIRRVEQREAVALSTRTGGPSPTGCGTARRSPKIGGCSAAPAVVPAAARPAGCRCTGRASHGGERRRSGCSVDRPDLRVRHREQRDLRRPLPDARSPRRLYATASAPSSGAIGSPTKSRTARAASPSRPPVSTSCAAGSTSSPRQVACDRRATPRRRLAPAVRHEDRRRRVDRSASAARAAPARTVRCSGTSDRPSYSRTSRPSSLTSSAYSTLLEQDRRRRGRCRGAGCRTAGADRGRDAPSTCGAGAGRRRRRPSRSAARPAWLTRTSVARPKAG